MSHHATSHKSRRPQGTVLQRIVADEFYPHLLAREDAGRPVPEFVIREFEAYRDCGDFACAHACLTCPRCAFKRDIPLSCRRRGWCPACLQRRCLDRSTFLRERVIGSTPVRHWAFSVAPPLRFYIGFDPSLLTEVLNCYTDAQARCLKWKAKKLLKLKSVNQAIPASITTIQRWSKTLDLNVHFHSIVADGVFVQREPDGEVTFHQLPPLTRQEIEDVAWDACLRIRKVLVQRGVWQDLPEDDVATASAPARRHITGLLRLGRGEPRVYRFCGTARRHADDRAPLDGLQAFDLSVGEPVRAGDGDELEKLTRYVLNPPFSDEQLHDRADGTVLYTYKRANSDGTRSRVLTHEKLMDKLVLLTPQPYANLIRFHGAYAPNARIRSHAVPEFIETHVEDSTAFDNDEDDQRAWSELLIHSFGADVMMCPRGCGRLRLTAIKSRHYTYRRRSGVPPGT